MRDEVVALRVCRLDVFPGKGHTRREFFLAIICEEVVPIAALSEALLPGFIQRGFQALMGVSLLREGSVADRISRICVQAIYIGEAKPA